MQIISVLMAEDLVPSKGRTAKDQERLDIGYAKGFYVTPVFQHVAEDEGDPDLRQCYKIFYGCILRIQ